MPSSLLPSYTLPRGTMPLGPTRRTPRAPTAARVCSRGPRGGGGESSAHPRHAVFGGRISDFQISARHPQRGAFSYPHSYTHASQRIVYSCAPDNGASSPGATRSGPGAASLVVPAVPLGSFLHPSCLRGTYERRAGNERRARYMWRRARHHRINPGTVPAPLVLPHLDSVGHEFRPLGLQVPLGRSPGVLHADSCLLVYVMTSAPPSLFRLHTERC